MCRVYKMSWDEGNHQWRKTFKGKPYRVTCQQLGLDRDFWTKQLSYQAANRWWDTVRGSVNPGPDTRIKALEMAVGRSISTTDDANAVLMDIMANLANDSAYRLPEGFSRLWLGEEKFAKLADGVSNLLEPAAIPTDQLVSTSITQYLAIQAARQKPKTFQEQKDFLVQLKDDYGKVDISSFDEDFLVSMFQHISVMAVAPTTKKKRFNIFKQFVRWIAEMNRIQLPRNIASNLYKFKCHPKKIKVYSVPEIQTALAALPDKLKCWALLGLNCGMTNVDIGGMTKDMVEDGKLTRRRVKTGDNTNVPTVSYPLWPETLTLLNQFKSNHPSLWFVSRAGTALLENSITDGNVSTKDLVGLHFRNKKGDCPLMLKEFRSIAATLLESHEVYGRYVSHFLGHAPQGIKDRHYAAPSSEVFRSAMNWLHSQIFASAE